MTTLNVTIAQLFEVLTTANYNGFAYVRYSKQLKENNEITQVTESQIYIGANFENMIRAREEKQGLEQREIGSANYENVSKLGAIYKNDGTYAVKMLGKKNGSKTTYIHNGIEYNSKKELQPLGILPQSFFEPKAIVDKRFSDENDFTWNVLKLINVDSIKFDTIQYNIIGKQNDIKLSELVAKVHKAKKELLKAKTEKTQIAKKELIKDLSKEINLFKLGANKEVIERVLTLEQA